MGHCGIPTFTCILLLVSMAALYASATLSDSDLEGEAGDDVSSFAADTPHLRVHYREILENSMINVNNRGRQGRIADSGGYPDRIDNTGRRLEPGTEWRTEIGPNGARRRARPGRGRGRGSRLGRVPLGVSRRMMRFARRLSTATTPFALRLFKTIQEQPEQDFVMSPLSVHAVLTMTYMGARGSTAREMLRTLGLHQARLRRQKAHQAYQALLASMNFNNPKVKVKNANGVFVKPNIAMEQSFRQGLNQMYNARFSNFNFFHPLGPEVPINTWVANMTGNKIQDLLAAGSIDQDTAMILINAVYFNASWQDPFDPTLTRPGQFLSLNQGIKRMNMMRSSGRFNYTNRQNYQVVEIPYVGDRMAMYIFIPHTITRFAHFIQEITDSERQGEDLFANLTMTPITVILPKFKIDIAPINLKNYLQTMGMSKAFRRNKADFSGISASAELFIESVSHKALIEVSETGTEAAAASVVMISLRSSIMTFGEMKIDRPFLFAIRDKTMNAILFMGTYLGQTV